MTMLAKWLRKAANIFAEKPEVKEDDFGLEHILLYHGLAGSSPENQRQFKDVRADILSAISRKNSQNLCINLKIAPLWWEEKLQRIFDEAKSQSAEATLISLLPTLDSMQEAAEIDPLLHGDWRVRANAAQVLAFLKAEQAQSRMIQSLHDTASGASPAYCHIARALAAFPSAEAREALARHLRHQEAWIRVDSINALSKWPLVEVTSVLISAFAEEHDFVDYAAVAVARTHKPIEFLQSEDEKVVDLGATILVGVLEAAQGTFSINSDLLPELEVQKCLAPLLSAASTRANPVRLRALARLTEWLDQNYHQHRLEAPGYPSREEIAAAREKLKKLTEAINFNQVLEKALTEENAKTTYNSAVRNAIKLAGELKLADATDLLLQLFESAPLYCNDIIEALGQIGDTRCLPVLLKCAGTVVNMEARTQMALNANPIHEKEPAKAKTYWCILRALGNLPGAESQSFLIRATQDEAGDKREEALSSLVELWSKEEGKTSRPAEVKNTLQRCLGDPSPQVRIKAIEGAARLDLADLITPVVAMVNSQEISVNRAVFAALEAFAENGHKEPIRAALTQARSSQSNNVKVKRIDEFIQHHL